MFMNAVNRQTDSRIGQPWSNEEDKQLLEEIGTKIDINTIASTHKRTIKGIKLRLVHNAIQAIDKGLFDVENAAVHFGISYLDIEEQRAKKIKERNIATFKEKQPEYHEKYLELLTEIRDSLKVLTNHICSEQFAQPSVKFSQPYQQLEPVSAPPSPLKPVVKIIKKPNLNPIKYSESMPSLPSLISHLNEQHNDNNDTISLKMPLPKLKVEVQ
jgi:hypothetical protein